MRKIFIILMLGITPFLFSCVKNDSSSTSSLGSKSKSNDATNQVNDTKTQSSISAIDKCIDKIQRKTEEIEKRPYYEFIYCYQPFNSPSECFLPRKTHTYEVITDSCPEYEKQALNSQNPSMVFIVLKKTSNCGKTYKRTWKIDHPLTSKEKSILTKQINNYLGSYDCEESSD